MLTSFFEEFPTKENLEKIKLISWKTKLYIAAKSVEEFNAIKSQIKNKNVKEVVYWPILERKEGYWISPFSSKKALKRVLKELQGQQIPVLLDLELPTTQNFWLYITQGLWFLMNKYNIKNFIANYQGIICLAEYYPQGKFKQAMLKFLGLHYEFKKVRVIKMLYHSLHDFSDDFLRTELEKGLKKWGGSFVVGFGTIAPGIHGTETVLSPKQLKRDLEIAKECGVKEVVIFRLGGVDRRYVRVLKK